MKPVKLLQVDGWEMLEEMTSDPDTELHGYFSDNGGDTEGNAYLMLVDDLTDDQKAELIKRGAIEVDGYKADIHYMDEEALEQAGIDDQDEGWFVERDGRFMNLDEAADLWCGWSVNFDALMVFSQEDYTIITKDEGVIEVRAGKGTDGAKIKKISFDGSRPDAWVGAWQSIYPALPLNCTFWQPNGERLSTNDIPSYLDYHRARPELDAVMTAAEAAQVYRLAEPTVRQAINRGTIKGRKSGGTWLILKADAEKRWGTKSNE